MHGAPFPVPPHTVHAPSTLPFVKRKRARQASKHPLTLLGLLVVAAGANGHPIWRHLTGMDPTARFLHISSRCYEFGTTSKHFWNRNCTNLNVLSRVRFQCELYLTVTVSFKTKMEIGTSGLKRRVQASGPATKRLATEEHGAADGPTLYERAPGSAISLDDFEGLAVERLRALSRVEDAQSRGAKDINSIVADAVKNSHLSRRTPEEREQDVISHWVLRLAFAASEELRKRFLNFEVALFRYRFAQTKGEEQLQMFLEKNDFAFSKISAEEKKKFKDGLEKVYLVTNGWRGGTAKPFERVDHYKVHFTDVLDLVGKRGVFLHKGFAFVPETDLISILVSRFRMRISRQLAVAYRSLPYVRNHDERIKPILKKLENAYLGPNFGIEGAADVHSGISIETIDTFAPRSFPLCMRQCHNAMKREHHLKHFARLQFQLFLKGIGISMQDCLKFFSREFMKKPMTQEEFNKKYAYNIRHAYGQEGKRKDYYPRNCMQIIMGEQPSGPNEHHGCPFKSSSEQYLRTQLVRQLGMNASGKIDQIMEKVRDKQPQHACRLHFEAAHPGAIPQDAGNHPNAWFKESYEYFLEQEKK